MKWGVIALFDVVGSKGIWKRVPAELVLSRMQTLKAAVHAKDAAQSG